MARFLFSVHALMTVLRYTGVYASSAYGYGAGSATATIDSGVVIGLTTTPPGGSSQIEKYLGIPFAAKPVRFEPPVSPAPWSSPFDASNYGPACIQEFPVAASPTREQTIAWFNTPPPPAGESEDCLNVNIYTPSSAGKRPVMVWIYGGSLTFGANSLPAYDGSFMASNQDIVVVAINYRTNVFGFPGSPQLSPQGRNLGWLDQHLALDWVQRNIHAFGGDPAQVTIVGESAGAASVDALVLSCPQDPPFAGAILESGQASIFALSANYSASWSTLVAAVGCSKSSDILACVQAVPATEIKSTIENKSLSFRPVKDNITLVSHPFAARKAGDAAHVPILIGSNADEGRLFVVNVNSTLMYFQAYLPNQTQTFYNDVLAAYPIGSPGISTEYQQLSAIHTDYLVGCAVPYLTNASIAGGFQTYRYYFNASFPNTQIFSGAGVYHSSEIPQIFGTYPLGGVTTKEEQLSSLIQKTWADFVKNPSAGPGWNQVPSVGVLGSPGSPLEYTVDQSALDKRCSLFYPIYSALYT